jgi:hypothetical protein
VKYPLIKDSAFQAQNPLLEDILVNLAVTMPIDYETKTSSRIKITAVIDSLIDSDDGLFFYISSKKSPIHHIKMGRKFRRVHQSEKQKRAKTDLDFQ